MIANASVRESSVPSVVVVDPRFDLYAPLAVAAREGKLDLHLRSSAADAMRLARRIRVDAWLVAEDLDDMSGHDLVELLAEHDGGRAAGKVAMVGAVPGEARVGRILTEAVAREAGAEAVLDRPISLADLAALLAQPVAQRPQAAIPAGSVGRRLVTLPVGIGAAVVTVAILMMG